MKISLAVALMLSGLALAASTSSVVIALTHSPQTPAAKIQMTADYVGVPISIHNDAKDPVTRAHEIERAYRMITEKLAQQPDLKVKPGVVSLSPREQSKSLSGYDASGGSYARLYVLGALKPDTNVFALTKRLYQALQGVPLPEATKVTYGNTVLAIEDAEKYRGQLLRLISKSIAETRNSLGPFGTVEIKGLENPVSVVQLNEREVLLFINYRVKIQTKPG